MFPHHKLASNHVSRFSFSFEEDNYYEMDENKLWFGFDLPFCIIIEQNRTKSCQHTDAHGCRCVSGICQVMIVLFLWCCAASDVSPTARNSSFLIPKHRYMTSPHRLSDNIPHFHITVVHVVYYSTHVSVSIIHTSTQNYIQCWPQGSNYTLHLAGRVVIDGRGN